MSYIPNDKERELLEKIEQATIKARKEADERLQKWHDEKPERDREYTAKVIETMKHRKEMYEFTIGPADNWIGAFRNDDNWLGTDNDWAGGLELSISEWMPVQGAVTLKRKEVITLIKQLQKFIDETK